MLIYYTAQIMMSEIGRYKKRHAEKHLEGYRRVRHGTILLVVGRVSETCLETPQPARNRD